MHGDKRISERRRSRPDRAIELAPARASALPAAAPSIRSCTDLTERAADTRGKLRIDPGSRRWVERGALRGHDDLQRQTGPCDRGRSGVGVAALERGKSYVR